MIAKEEQEEKLDLYKSKYSTLKAEETQIDTQANKTNAEITDSHDRIN